MEPRLHQKLRMVAIDNPGVRGKFKMSAAILDKRGNILSIGRNSYKTHPIMCNGLYKEEQLYLHAEADAIVKATRIDKDLSGCHMAVLRVKRGPDGKWVDALAKPCKGCMGLIDSVGIESVEWSVGNV
jgi:deoxycytidylate deaminase